MYDDACQRCTPYSCSSFSRGPHNVSRCAQPKWYSASSSSVSCLSNARLDFIWSRARRDSWGQHASIASTDAPVSGTAPCSSRRDRGHPEQASSAASLRRCHAVLTTMLGTGSGRAMQDGVHWHRRVSSTCSTRGAAQSDGVPPRRA